MRLGDVFLGVLADMTGFEKQVVTGGKKAGDKAGKAAGQSIGQQLKSALSPSNLLQPGNLLKGAAAGFLGAQVVDFFQDASSAASAEEAQIATLTESIRQNDKAWDGNVDAIESVIDARQALGFADDKQRDSLRGLVAITGDVNKAMELNRTAMDLARLRNIDLVTASDILGKVYGGNTGILSRYGIVLERGATSTEALARIQQMAQGQAEAYAEGNQGAAEAAAIAWDNLQEDIGTEVLPVFTALLRFGKDQLVPFIRNVLVPAIKLPITVISGLLSLVGELLKTFGPGLAILAGIITLTLIPTFVAWGASATAAGLATLVALAPILAPIAAIVAAVAGLTLAFNVAKGAVDNFALDFGDMGDRIHKIADRAGEDFQDVKDFIQKAMAEGGMSFEEAAAAADEHFGTITASTEQLVEESGKAWDQYQEQIRVTGDVVEEEVSGFTGTIIEKMDQGRIHVVEVALRMPGDIADALEEGRGAVTMAANKLRDAIEGELDPIDEIADLQGQLAGEDLAAGLKSKDPIVRLRAQQLYQTIQDRLSQLGAYAWGSAIAKAWADGLASRWGYAHAKAVYLGTALSGPLEGYSPPKEGPLKDIDKWGANIGEAWANGLRSAVAGGIGSLGIGSMTPRLATVGLPAAGALAGPGVTNQWILNVDGVPRTVDSKRGAIDELERLGESWG